MLGNWHANRSPWAPQTWAARRSELVGTSRGLWSVVMATSNRASTLSSKL
jgi:hypothetical protein